ncbi:MAG: VWA domain-containing protein, partial [Methanosarcinales archaeon]|nr:VWA domain-containing protein [Methanosarcinales archaeon]
MASIVDITNLTGMIFGNPDYLYAIIPILLIGIYYLKKSTKKVLILSRMIVLFLIIIALAAPYTLSTHTITNPHPTITILNDQTSSMDIFDAPVADTICETIQDRNPAAQIRAFSGDHSPIGDKIVQYARGDDHIILISDGNSNYGRDLVDAVSVVARTNTTVYAIKESPVRNDMSVEVIGSKNIIVGNKNTFGIVVRQAGRHAKYELVVKVDDGVVYQSTIDQNERVKVRKIPQTFNTLGSHVLCAEIIPAGDDYRSSNNIFYKSVYVVPKPDIQLVTDEESNLRDIVSGLYNASVSANLKELQGIKTVILDNRYINSLSSGDIEALRNFVSDGHGLVVVGGDNSYDRGGYLGSDFEKILPVKSYPSEYYGRNDVVLVLDISGSMRDSEIVSGTGVSFLNYEKALANKILDDKEFRDDYVGVVAFGGQAYVVSPLVYFGNDQTRASLKDTIRTIEPTGQLSTPLEDGLSMAEEMLANSAGAKDVIILSDGQKIDYERSLAIATQMKNK